MIENHLLYNIISAYIDRDTLFMSCKESKLKTLFLKKGFKDPVRTTQYNRVVHAKDVLRYTNPFRNLNLAHLPEIQEWSKKARTMFIHDEVQYWSISELQQVLGQLVNTEKVLYSIVYPVELHLGYTESFFPEAYQFESHGDYFTWYPDGNAEGSYKQPLNPWLLSTSKTIDGRGRSWTITKLQTMGAHHLFVATLGSHITEDSYTYDDFTVIKPESVLTGRRGSRGKLMRSRYIQSILYYLLALKKPDANSAIAKMRQLTHGDENPSEALFVAQLSRQIQDTKLFDSMGNFKVKEGIWDSLCGALGDEVTYVFDKKKFDIIKLERFITNCEPAVLRVQRSFVDYQVPKDKLAPEIGTSWSGVDDGENSIFYWAYIQSMDRVREPYVLSEPMQDWRVVTHLGMIECARLDFRNNQTTCVELGLEVSLTPLDNFIGYRKFIRRTGVCSGVSTLGLPWVQDPLSRFEQGLITSKQMEEELFEKAPVKQTKSVPEMKGNLQVTVCACGATVKYHKDGLQTFKEHIQRLGDMDKLKGRSAAFFSRRSSCYSYSGGSHESRGWPDWLEKMAEKLDLSDEFDHCLIQIYDQDAGIGYHADDESCYHENTVVTVNLTGNCTFSVKCTDETHNELREGDVLVMGKGSQKNHKHKVGGTTTGRISLTFRDGIIGPEAGSDTLSSYSENEADFDESLEILRRNSKHLCCVDRISEHMGIQREICVSIINSRIPRAIEEIKDGGMSVSTLLHIARELDIQLYIQNDRGCIGQKGSFKEMSCFVGEDHLSFYQGPRMDVTFSNALAFNGDISSCRYSYSEKRAKLLVESFQEGFTGVCLNKFQKKKAEMGSAVGEGEFDVFVSLGFAGSGKSYYPQTLLKGGNYSNTLVIVPRKALSMDWRNKVHKDVKVVTFESAFKEKTRAYQNIIIDEVGLLPNGYIDVVYGSFLFETMLILGDPLQCGYFNRNDEVFLAPNKENAFNLLKGTCSYLYKTHRLPSDQRVFGVPSHGEKVGKYVTWNEKVAKDVKIVASRKRKDIEGERASTIGENQGLSLHRVNLIVDDDWCLLSEESVMVAFTRARRCINICVDEKTKLKVIKHAKSSLLKTIFKGYLVDKSIIMGLLSCHIKSFELIEKEMRLGDTDDMEERLAGDPYLKGLLCLLEDDEAQEVELPEVHAPQPERTHLYLSARENEISISDLKAREDREAITEAGITEQINEEGYRGENGNPMTHKALYLHHKNADVATFMMSVKKRLRFRDPEKNRRKYEKCKGFGVQLFKVMKNTYQLASPNALPELDKMEAAFTRKRLAKSQKLIEKHSYRSDPDWPSNYLKIFLKQQVCTKMEKRGVDAKAGQTIACFSHSVLCKFGPQLRRTEKALRAQLGDNVMIYSQKNYTDLDNWSRTYVDYMLGTDSDYEAFDRSQDEKILSFEVEVLKFFLWPEELINEYVELKLMMGCSMGDLAIMRFSGEFGTFFFNTICNMAFTCLRYSITKDTPICYAGDDMYAPGVLPVKGDYEHVLKELQLKAKVNVSDSPLFCGWRMTPYGIIKDPNLLLDRWKIAERDGKLDQCKVNYALEAVYGYRLGEHLYDVNIDIDAQQELVRKIVKVKDSLPKGIARLFSKDPNECYSDGEELELRVSAEAEYLGDPEEDHAGARSRSG
nr:replicase [Carrot vitivirus 1]